MSTVSERYEAIGSVLYPLSSFADNCVMRVHDMNQVFKVNLVPWRQIILMMGSEMPSMSEACNHYYARYATALNTIDRTAASLVHRTYRGHRLRKLSAKIVHTTPAGLDVGVVCDSYSACKVPIITSWLAHHERFHVLTSIFFSGPQPGRKTLHRDHRLPSSALLSPKYPGPQEDLLQLG